MESYAEFCEAGVARRREAAGGTDERRKTLAERHPAACVLWRSSVPHPTGSAGRSCDAHRFFSSLCLCVSVVQQRCVIYSPSRMPNYGFAIDLRKCIGCHACTIACKAEHEIPIGVNRCWVKTVEKGTFPNTQRFFFPVLCNQCDEAPCVRICPTSALVKRRDGIVDLHGDV